MTLGQCREVKEEDGDDERSGNVRARSLFSTKELPSTSIRTPGPFYSFAQVRHRVSPYPAHRLVVETTMQTDLHPYLPRWMAPSGTQRLSFPLGSASAPAGSRVVHGDNQSTIVAKAEAMQAMSQLRPKAQRCFQLLASLSYLHNRR